MKQTPVGDALFTKTQQRVLGLLYGNPDRSFYANEVVRWADMGRGTVRRELDRLTKAGLLRVRREGNQLHYQADPTSPVFQELRGIVMKTFGVAAVLRSALAPLTGAVKIAFIYGPVANGAECGDNDIDLMLIGRDLSYAAVMDHLGEIENCHGCKVNLSIYSPEELTKRLRTDNTFVQRVMDQQKYFLIGSADDINGFQTAGRHRPRP